MHSGVQAHCSICRHSAPLAWPCGSHSFGVFQCSKEIRLSRSRFTLLLHQLTSVCLDVEWSPCLTQPGMLCRSSPIHILMFLQVHCGPARSPTSQGPIHTVWALMSRPVFGSLEALSALPSTKHVYIFVIALCDRARRPNAGLDCCYAWAMCTADALATTTQAAMTIATRVVVVCQAYGGQACLSGPPLLYICRHLSTPPPHLLASPCSYVGHTRPRGSRRPACAATCLPTPIIKKTIFQHMPSGYAGQRSA